MHQFEPCKYTKYLNIFGGACKMLCVQISEKVLIWNWIWGRESSASYLLKSTSPWASFFEYIGKLFMVDSEARFLAVRIMLGRYEPPCPNDDFQISASNCKEWTSLFLEMIVMLMASSVSFGCAKEGVLFKKKMLLAMVDHVSCSNVHFLAVISSKKEVVGCLASFQGVRLQITQII